MRTVTHQEWLAEGERRFGSEKLNWKFICPACGHIAAIRDWREAGASQGEVAFSCVGRSLGVVEGKKSPCNYAGGGLFRLNPITIVAEDSGEKLGEVFDFAPGEEEGI